MIGPLRESLIEAANAGHLQKPAELSEEAWRQRLAELHPNATPEEVSKARALAEAMWADGADPDFGV